MTTFSPREIVSELDRFIVGQNDAKRAVAIALRNRWRRQQLEGRCARRYAQEHPDDRPDRLRQDRDLAPAGEARQRAVHQGRGDQVHRGRLCRPRRRADHPRPGRGRHRPGADERRKQVAGAGAAAAEERVLDALVGATASPRPARSSAESSRASELDDKEIEIEMQPAAQPACRCSRSPACPAPRSA